MLVGCDDLCGAQDGPRPQWPRASVEFVESSSAHCASDPLRTGTVRAPALRLRRSALQSSSLLARREDFSWENNHRERKERRDYAFSFFFAFFAFSAVNSPPWLRLRRSALFAPLRCTFGFNILVAAPLLCILLRLKQSLLALVPFYSNPLFRLFSVFL